jgi:hypothetical protein
VYRRRGQRSWIDQTDARSIGELERRSRMARQRVFGPANLPVARHSKVNVNGAPVAESHELMLPPTIDRDDHGTGQGTQALR